MKKKFIILVHSSPKVLSLAKPAIYEYLKAEGFGWWHWYPYAWLLATSKTSMNVVTLRQAMSTIAPHLNHLEFELPEGFSWTGASNPKHFEWILEQFGRPYVPPQTGFPPPQG